MAKPSAAVETTKTITTVPMQILSTHSFGAAKTFTLAYTKERMTTSQQPVSAPSLTWRSSCLSNLRHTY